MTAPDRACGAVPGTGPAGVMARRTAAQFAGQLRRLGAEVTMVAGHAIARYRGVEVSVRFHREVDAFDVAWRTDVPAEAGTAIGSMAGVRRALGLPTHPVVTLGRTGLRNSRVHILRPGWYATAECGVGLRGDPVEGSPREVTCRRCRCIWRQR